MRVAIVGIAPLRDRAVLGGSYASSLGEALEARGVQAEIWTRKGAEPLAEVNVRVRHVWRPGFLAWLDILRALRNLKPDVVHLQYYFFLFGNSAASELSTLLLALCCAIRRTPLVVTMHDVPRKDQITRQYITMHKYRYPAPIVRAGLAILFAVLGKSARAFSVDNNALVERLVEFGIAREKINVVPLWPRPEKAFDRSDARRQLGISADACVVMFFGYATGYKGLEYLLEAFQILEERKSPVLLLLGAGVHPKMGHTGDYQRYYRSLEARARSLSSVRFEGYIRIADLGKFISAADTGVLPYVEHHGASGPLYHYLGQHRPVLVSKAIAESNPLLRTGVFDVTPEAIADAIDRFCCDSAIRRAVEAECSALRDAAFSDASIDRTKNTYERVLGLNLP